MQTKSCSKRKDKQLNGSQKIQLDYRINQVKVANEARLRCET